MSQRESIENTRGAKRISTKWRKNFRIHYRYDEFIQKCLNKCRIDKDFDVGTKSTKLLDTIVREWFEMKTIEEFCKEDPDLRIQIRKQKEKELWMDFLFDTCDMREIDALRHACEDLLSLKEHK